MSRLLAAAALAVAVASAAPVFADQAADERVRMLEVLRYGIDSQVLAVVARLRETRDASLGPEMAVTLAQSRSTQVRKEILDACAELGVRDAEEAARSIAAAGATENPIVVSSAVSYLSAIGASGLAGLFLPLVDSSDAPLSSTAIRALGATRDPAAVAPLLAKLDSPTFPSNRRGELVRALGELGDPRAVDPLLALATSAESEPVLRMYAIEALGRIGDPRVARQLQALFGSDNALIRASTAGALAALALEDALPSLIAGLRDENVKVRLECAKALGRPLPESQAASAVAILSWKARNDPDRQVRAQSIASLAETGRADSMRFLRDLLPDRAAPLESREAALGSLAKHLDGESLAAIRKLVDAEMGAEQPGTLQMVARVLSAAAAPALEPVYAALLGSRDFAVRIAAIRGIVLNRLTGEREKLAGIAAADPHPSVRTEAERALARLSQGGAANPDAPTSSAR